MTGHKDSVRAIQMVPGTNQLASCSYDRYFSGSAHQPAHLIIKDGCRTIKLWNLSEDKGKCVATLVGHKFEVVTLNVGKHVAVQISHIHRE